MRGWLLLVKAENWVNHLIHVFLLYIYIYIVRCRNNRNHVKVAKRLNGALVDLNGKMMFHDASVLNLFNLYYDHNPVSVFFFLQV